MEGEGINRWNGNSGKNEDKKGRGIETRGTRSKELKIMKGKLGGGWGGDEII